MSQFQVAAAMGNGATVLFGLTAAGETEALLLAYKQLFWFPQAAGRLTVVQLGNSVSRVRGAGP